MSALINSVLLKLWDEMDPRRVRSVLAVWIEISKKGGSNQADLPLPGNATHHIVILFYGMVHSW